MGRRAKVLVLMTSPLDKIVHALRVVQSMKGQRTELEITWVVRRVYEPLVACFDFVDRTIVFQRSEALVRFGSLLRQIRRESYDFVLDFEGHARTGAMCFFSRSKRKIGLATAREGAAISYGEVIRTSVGDDRHLIDQLKAFGSVFGVGFDVCERLRIPEGSSLPKELRAAQRLSGPRVCLFPGRYKAARAWPEMLDLGQKIVETWEEAQVVVLGVVPSVLKNQVHERILDYQGRLSWPQICQILSESDLAVANDNGPAQLAGGLGCRNLTLYSYVSPEARGSYPVGKRGNAVLRAPGGDVSRLGLESVFAEVEKLLVP